jgi:DNA-binding MarR family transcriptional regulator
MVRHGLVTRRRSDDNGRIVLIEITPDGRRTVEGLLPFVQDLEKAALESMQPDEIQNLKQSLKRLEENLAAFRDEANSIPGR